MKIGRDERICGMLKTNKCANGIVNALEIAKENWRWFHSYKMRLAKYKKMEFEQITSLGETTTTTKTTHPLFFFKRVENEQLFMGFLFYCKALQGFFFSSLPSKSPLGMEDAFAN